MAETGRRRRPRKVNWLMFRFRAAFVIALSLIVLAPVAGAAKQVKIRHAGLTLNANLTLAPGKALADGVVLMVHGALAHNRMEIMRTQQALLAERQLNSLAINLGLGLDDRHGMYDCATLHRYRHGDAVVEIGRWVDWLKAQGTGPITLLGHSRGGNQAALYAAGTPDPAVERAVLAAPATWAPGQYERAYRNRYEKDLAPLLAKAETLLAAGSGEAVMEGIDFSFCPKTRVTAATFADQYRPNPQRDTPTVAGRSKIPVLVIAAGADRINGLLAEKMKGRAKGKVRFALIEDAGHFFLDFYGEDLADAVAEFAGGPGS